MTPWLRFNAVGTLGSAIQLGALSLLLKLGVHYLAATAIAVELAVLHNYAWHRRWTWAGCSTSGALWRFHLANGLVSILSNVVLMRVFTGSFGMPPLAANVLAIAITSLVNFGLGDRWVFAARSSQPAGAVAMQSISTRTSRGRRAASTVARAGGFSGK